MTQSLVRDPSLFWNLIIKCAMSLKVTVALAMQSSFFETLLGRPRKP